MCRRLDCLIGLFAVLIVLVIALSPRIAQGAEEGRLLVASEALTGGYKQAVIAVGPPAVDGGHYGVILNLPSRATMAQMFPDFAPARAIKGPLYIGGPNHYRVIFAMTTIKPEGEKNAVPMGGGIWLYISAKAIDRLIETHPNDARYYVGIVFWRPGELDQEIKRGLWRAMPLDTKELFRPDVGTLWRRLGGTKGI